MPIREFNNDNQLRQLMNSVPEEKPTQVEWERMKTRLQAEGLLADKGSRSIFFYFSLSAVVIAFLGTFFLMNVNRKSSVSTNQTAGVTPLITQPVAEINNQITAGKNTANTISSSVVPVEKSINASSDKTIPVKSKSTGLHSHVSKTNSSSSVNTITNNQSDITNSSDEKNVIETKENITALTGNSEAAGISQSPVTVEDNSKTIEKNVESNSSNESGRNTPKRNSSHKWFTGVYASYDMNSIAFSAMNSTGKEMVKNGIPVKDNFQFTAGAIIGYRLTSKFVLESGILYSQKRKLDYSYLQAATNSPAYDHYEYHFSGSYIEVPLKADFFVYQTHRSGMNWGIYGAIGAITTFNLPEKDNDYYLHESLNETGSHTTKITMKPGGVGFTPLLAVGWQMRFSRNWNLYIEPGYEPHATSIFKHSSVDDVPVHPYIRTPRIAFGVKYNL